MCSQWGGRGPTFTCPVYGRYVNSGAGMQPKQKKRRNSQFVRWRRNIETSIASSASRVPSELEGVMFTMYLYGYMWSITTDDWCEITVLPREWPPPPPSFFGCIAIPTPVENYRDLGTDTCAHTASERAVDTR